MKTKLKLKRWVCLMIGFLCGILFVLSLQYISKNTSKWYQECDDHYGYTVDYYTCRQYHIHK